MRYSIAILLMVFTAFPVEAARTIPITLAEAIALALRNNISIKNAYLSRISDKFSLVVAKDEFWPQFSTSASYSHTSTFDDTTMRYDDTADASREVGVTLQLPTGGQLALTETLTGSFARTGDSFTSTRALSLTQPLLQGGGLTAGMASLTSAKYSEQSSVLSLKSTLISLVTQVIKQYRTYYLAERSVEIARLSLERSQAQLKMTKALIKARRQPEVELIQAQAALANQRLSHKSAINSANTARFALLNLLRLNESVRLRLIEPITVARSRLRLKQVLKVAYENRPDYLQSLISVKSAELQKKVAENDKLWQLDLSAEVTMSGTGDTRGATSRNRSIHEDHPDTVVGLTLTIPLNDISKDQALLNAKIALIQANNDKVSSHESIRLEIINLLNNLEISLEQVELAKQSLELSRKQLKLEQQKLKAGRSSNFQVVSYQNELTSAENNYLSTQISYLNSLTDLDQSMGTTLDHWGVTIKKDKSLQPTNVSDFKVEQGSSLILPEGLH